MTNATLPTSVGLALGHQKIKINVDQPTKIKTIGVNVATSNGVTYTALNNLVTGSAYIVPASTNFQIYAIEDSYLTAVASTATVLQVGYDDDGAGTNYTVLVDLSLCMNVLQSLDTAGALCPGFPVTNVSAPTGKHLVVKSNGGASTPKFLIMLSGIETN